MEFKSNRIACQDCGSSDGIAPTTTGVGYCHACPKDKAFKSKETMLEWAESPVIEKTVKPKESYEGRGITTKTAQVYGVTTDGDRVFFNYSGATKTRYADKSFTSDPLFKQAGLFGQHLFTGGKKLTICEGEFDAMSAFQMHGSRYAFVSVKNGANSALKNVKENIEWIQKFDEVYLDFDSDEPGKEAAKAVADFLCTFKKVYVVEHRGLYKDANDYLSNGAEADYKSDWWNASEYKLDGVIKSSELYEEVMKPVQLPMCSYPWDGLNLMCYGLRFEEIVSITAGTGVGKSTFVKELITEVHQFTDEKIGVLSLEESVGTAALGIMSLKAGQRLHLPTKQQMVDHILKNPDNIVRKKNLPDSVADEVKENAFHEMMKDDRFMFLQHRGRIDMDSVLNQLRYLATMQDCRVILLDHYSILVGLVARKGNEREAIDEVMHQLRSIVEETGILLIGISHLSKPGQQRQTHEEGGRVKLGDMRGSQSIAQLSNIAIALEGDRQHEDPNMRNVTTVRVLKNRFSGETGIACTLQYDEKTGRMIEVETKDLEVAL